MNRDFDLEKALAGEPVVTRDGREVKDLHLFTSVQTYYPVVGIIEGRILSFSKEGKYLTNRSESDKDLFMA